MNGSTHSDEVQLMAHVLEGHNQEELLRRLDCDLSTLNRLRGCGVIKDQLLLHGVAEGVGIDPVKLGQLVGIEYDPDFDVDAYLGEGQGQAG